MVRQFHKINYIPILNNNDQPKKESKEKINLICIYLLFYRESEYLILNEYSQ